MDASDSESTLCFHIRHFFDNLRCTRSAHFCTARKWISADKVNAAKRTSWWWLRWLNWKEEVDSATAGIWPSSTCCAETLSHCPPVRLQIFASFEVKTQCISRLPKYIKIETMIICFLSHTTAKKWIFNFLSKKKCRCLIRIVARLPPRASWFQRTPGFVLTAFRFPSTAPSSVMLAKAPRPPLARKYEEETKI